MAKYKIRDNQTGKTVVISGDSPPTEQDAEQIFADAGLRGDTKPQANMLQSVLGGVKGVGDFIAPKVTAAATGAVNTGGMIKDYIDYNRATDPQQKAAEAQSYTQRMNAANDSFKEFGFDSNKAVGNQFDLMKYLKGSTAAGGELATLATPVKGNLGARMIANAVPGVTSAIGEDKGIVDIAKAGINSSLMATGSEYAMKGAGKAVKKVGESLTKSGESLGLKRFGLTKLDKATFKKKFGEDVTEFVKKNKLVGEDITGAQAVHDKLQDSFDEIAKKSGLEIDTQDLVSKLTEKSKAMAKDPSPAVRTKANVVQQYADNLMEYLDNAEKIDIGKVSKLRGEVDDLANFNKTGADADAYKTIRDILQGKVRERADDAGLKGAEGKSLTELGMSLNKLKTFLNMAEKRDPTLSSKLPLGLMKGVLMGTGGVGGAAFGPLGAALGIGAGFAADNLVNSPKFMQNASKATTKAGNKIQSVTSNKILNQLLMKAAQLSGVKASQALPE